MTQIAVAILNFNGEKLLKQFLPSVIQNSSGADIFVIDNGSSDASLHVLKDHFPQVRVVALDSNYGFCGGYNRGLRHIDAAYYVLLNSDIEVTPGWLPPLQKLLDEDQLIAAVQPRVLSYHNKTKFEYAGAGGGFIDSLGYPFCRGRVFDFTETDTGQYSDTREVFWASGACLMIRSSAYEKFGGLDEDFFAHMEEIDLCWKIIRSSHKVYYCGASIVYHAGAGTLAYESPRKTYLNFRNGLILLVKHLGPSEVVYKILARMILDWMAALRFLFKGMFGNAWSVFRAHAHFIGHLKNHISKRHTIRKPYPHYPRKNIYRGLIVYTYFIKRQGVIDVSNPR